MIHIYLDRGTTPDFGYDTENGLWKVMVFAASKSGFVSLTQNRRPASVPLPRRFFAMPTSRYRPIGSTQVSAPDGKPEILSDRVDTDTLSSAWSHHFLGLDIPADNVFCHIPARSYII